MLNAFHRISLLILGSALILFANEQEQMSYYAQMGKNILMEKFAISANDLEVELVYLPRTAESLDANLLFRPVINTPNLRPGRMMMWITAYRNGEIVSKFSVPLNVTVHQKVLVAAAELDRNEELSRDNIQLLRIELDREPDYYLRDLSEIDGKIAAQRIREGQTIRSTMVREKPDIFKGDPVTIQIRGNNFRIQADGRAWEDGKIGEKIRVSNRITGKMMQAEIHSPDLVIVQ